MVKNPPANAKGLDLILGQEDPLEKEMATPPVFFPGKSHGQSSLVGYSPWGCKEWDMKVKEVSEKVGLKLNIKKMKIMASGPITSLQIDGETVETVTEFIFVGS